MSSYIVSPVMVLKMSFCWNPMIQIILKDHEQYFEWVIPSTSKPNIVFLLRNTNWRYFSANNTIIAVYTNTHKQLGFLDSQCCVYQTHQRLVAWSMSADSVLPWQPVLYVVCHLCSSEQPPKERKNTLIWTDRQMLQVSSLPLLTYKQCK